MSRLISPLGPRRIQTTLALTKEQTQVLVDAEPFFVGLGLAAALMCGRCREGVEGNFDPEHGFTVACACTKREYRGADIAVPPIPTAPAAREALPNGLKREEPISGFAIQFIKAYEQVLSSLTLHYRLFCTRCTAGGNQNNGVYGMGDSKGERWVAECACTKRVATRHASAGAAVPPATVH